MSHSFFGLDFHIYVIILLIGIGQLDNDVLKSVQQKISIHSASQRAPLNLNVNYVTVMKYTCTYQFSNKTELFKNFYGMHFYLDLLANILAFNVGFISCFYFSAWSKQVCYELTAEFNCNSMSTIIVLLVFIKFEELTRKKYWF